MSTRITKPEPLAPVPAGDNCVVCWGIGKPFGSGNTPEQIEIIFENIEKGPGWLAGDGEPENSTFICSQDPFNECHFISPELGGPVAQVTFNVNNTFILGDSSASVPDFLSTTGIACMVVAGNEKTDKFIGGTATIRIPGVS